jgi:TolB-like protein/Flp pilus assembly protein TadD
MTLAPGTRLGHFEIVGPIGAGGMGEVYRATDTTLGRDVALKVLPAQLANDAERLARFQREARTVAALNHPHIVTIHSVGDAEGVHFLTMELVEGQSLDRVIPERGLPADQILEIAGAVAEALAAAHEKGIVHRDLKPANVMVTPEGRVKVLDFGLAKDLRPTDPTDATLTSAGHTAAGVVMGTPAYMSPEQVAGRTVDCRTDLFSLGVILYEMARGQRPFEGASSAELASAILRDTPRPLSEIRSDLPADLARVIRRCLEKDPRQRVQTARDVANELRDMGRPFSSTVGGPEPARVSTDAGSGGTRPDGGFWVAVLPFRYAGANADLMALAEGLSDEIVIGLSRFSYLRVVARGSTAIAPRYVMEGNLRQAGTRLRVSVQLVDTATGAHLWAEHYERAFSPEALFELQDDLVSRIVSTVADAHGVLPRSMSDTVRSTPAEQLTPYEAVLRSFGYFQRVTPEELADAQRALEMALQRSPAYADAWAMLALLHAQDYGQGFDLQPDAVARSVAAARRAVECGPSNHLACFSLTQALFFQKEVQRFRNAAERAAALNPMDGNSIAFLGELLTYSGDAERGLALATRAKQLNPHHPGWYWYADYFHAYRQRDYKAALEIALKVNLPSHWGAHAALAMAYGQLGEHEAAGKALRTLLDLRPNFAATVRTHFERWWDPEFVDHLIEGLCKAGLEVPTHPAAGPPAAVVDAPRPPGSGAARADEGFWVAVLPFAYAGASPDLTALAEGLSEEIVTGLSRFSYLRVIARGSVRRYASQAVDVRTVGREIGARYVMEGSVRQAGSTLRIAAQLVDAASGAHLWAETYDRPFHPEAIFAVQDDVVPRVVSTVADMNGVLPRTMAELLRRRDPRSLSPYEAVLRWFGYISNLTAEEHALVRSALERVVGEAPDHADCWSVLSGAYAHEHMQGFNARPDPLGRALDAARRAVAAAPSNHLAHHMLAQALFFRREFQAFRGAAERAVALNPMDAYNRAHMGILRAYAGDWEHGLALAETAMQLNPHHPGWYRFGAFFSAYRRQDDRAALDVALRINMPSYFYTHAALAATYGQLGEKDAGRGALRELLALKPDFAMQVREEYGKWFGPGELVERLVDGLRKAGLDVPPGPGEILDPAAAGAPASGAEPVAIAVLPFSDMSPAKDQEYLCEGMAEEIMNALVRVEGIRVASRASTFRARRDGGDLKAIARALSVGHVLEGSVRTAGTRLRITAQLTDVASGYHLWSERFDREAADVFAVQDQIAAGVVAAVKARLAPGARLQPRPRTVNLDAYRAYLRGRHLRGKEHNAGVLQAFEESVHLDPSHAPSWTGLAEIMVLSAVFSLVPPREACSTARKALETAASLQGESADGWHVEAFACWIERRWDDMEVAWRRALEIEPRHVLALGSFGFSLCTLQRLEEAVPILERAMEADPLASFPYALTGLGHLTCGRLREAERHLEDALSFDKEDVTALYTLGMAKVALGKAEEGIALAERAVTLSHRGGVLVGVLGWALATAGRHDEARALLDELRARPHGSPTVVAEAWLLGALGEVDAAFEVLARAEPECQANLYLTGMPVFDSVRNDPRFTALLQRLGLPIDGRA